MKNFIKSAVLVGLSLAVSVALAAPQTPVEGNGGLVINQSKKARWLSRRIFQMPANYL